MSSPEFSRTNKVLFFASFLTLIAAGLGFGIRNGGVLGEWERVFGFTKTELGTITGGGLVGFGYTIIVCSLIIEFVGYKPLMVLAFFLHIASAAVTLAATPIFESYSDPLAAKNAAYECLYWGMILFSLANGICEAVINPLVATLYPRQKTHYLNILHAGWPGGLILGGFLAYLFVPLHSPMHLRWEIPIAMFLVPTLMYGLMMLPKKFPQPETKSAGVSFGTMLATFASPVLLFLLFLHACVGYVELGTDSWIVNILNNFFGTNAVWVLIYTSAIMFVLRFFAGPIVERINPVGLLFVSSVLGVTGLYMLGSFTTVSVIMVAATIYGVGKTFLWPTMLGVVGERFPKGGALVMGAMGGVGMLSAGYLGGPIIGYQQDYYASKHLEETAPSVYQEFKADEPKRVLFLPETTGLDGQRTKALSEAIEAAAAPGGAPVTAQQKSDWAAVGPAQIYGGQMALKLTALVPLTMAVGYLLLVFYFWAQGGYKQELLHEGGMEGEKYTGGVEGPIEG